MEGFIDYRLAKIINNQKKKDFTHILLTFPLLEKKSQYLSVILRYIGGGIQSLILKNNINLLLSI